MPNLRALLALTCRVAVLAVLAAMVAAPMACRKDNSGDNAGASQASTQKATAVSKFANRPLPVAAGAADWPTWRGDAAMTGSAAGRLAGRLKLCWTCDAGAPISASPVIVAGRIYLADEAGNAFCVELRTGRRLWRTAIGGVAKGGLSVMGGLVLVPTRDCKLDDGGTGGGVIAFRMTDGREQWRKLHSEGSVVGGVGVVDLAGVAGRAPGGQLVIFGGHDQQVRCFAADGRRKWQFDPKCHVNGGVSVDAGRAAVGGCDGMKLFILNPGGRVLRQFSSLGALPGTPVLIGDRAYVGEIGGEVECFDLKSGKRAWLYQASGDITASPAVAHGRLVFATVGGYVACLDSATGNRIWQRDVGDGGVKSSPVICDGKVILATDAGTVLMLDLATGRSMWQFKIGSPIESSPAVCGGAVIVGCSDGLVYAFGPEVP